MTRLLTEQDLVTQVVASRATWLPTADLWGSEVRSHGTSRMDLCFWTRRELVAVEVKRTDWRRVIGQASLNRYCADRSYIALWSPKVSDAVVTEAVRFGLGVIAVSIDDVQVVLKAPKASPYKALRSQILYSLRSRKHE